MIALDAPEWQLAVPYLVRIHVMAEQGTRERVGFLQGSQRLAHFFAFRSGLFGIHFEHGIVAEEFDCGGGFIGEGRSMRRVFPPQA